MTTKHWVWLETGGNQKYIFGSDRLRHMIGGSQMIYSIGTDWVGQTIAEMSSSDPSCTLQEVMATSGKALLLANSSDHAREFITRITRRALSEAPGLQLTGTIGPEFTTELPANHRTESQTDPAPTAELDFHSALRATWALHQKVRASRPAPAQRDPLLPWHEQCRDTGYPAAHYELYGKPDADKKIPEDDWHPASAAVAQRSNYKKPARKRMAAILDPENSPVLPHFAGENPDNGKSIPKEIDTLAHDGWIAIIHADGNGVGNLFTDLVGHIKTMTGEQQSISLAKFCEIQKTIAKELQESTERAVKVALEKTLKKLGWKDEQHIAEKYHGTFMPIIVGGDDVTIACHAGMALDFVQEFSTSFEQETAAPGNSALAPLVGAMYGTTGPCGLTASAGIAIVKPHHPLSSAYHLAEELITQAKKVDTQPGSTDPRKTTGSTETTRKSAAVDFHILHESTIAPLEELRKPLFTENNDGHCAVFRHCGPYLLDAPGAAHTVETPHLSTLLALCTALESDPQEDSQKSKISKPKLSAARAHELRAALDRSLDEYKNTLKLIEHRMKRESERTTAGDIPTPTPISQDEAENIDLFQLLAPGAAGKGNTHLLLPDAILWQGIRAQAPGPARPQSTDQGNPR